MPDRPPPTPHAASGEGTTLAQSRLKQRIIGDGFALSRSGWGRKAGPEAMPGHVMHNKTMLANNG
jgi:hypothetical protein